MLVAGRGLIASIRAGYFARNQIAVRTENRERINTTRTREIVYNFTKLERHRGALNVARYEAPPLNYQRRIF